LQQTFRRRRVHAASRPVILQLGFLLYLARQRHAPTDATRDLLRANWARAQRNGTTLSRPRAVRSASLPNVRDHAGQTSRHKTSRRLP
jgi:hypothetical protein